MTFGPFWRYYQSFDTLNGTLNLWNDIKTNHLSFDGASFYNKFLINFQYHPSIPPICTTHLYHPSVPPIYTTHLYHPSIIYIPPIYTTHLYHPSIPPVHTTRPYHQFIPPSYTTHLYHPSIPPIYTTRPYHLSTPPILCNHMQLTIVLIQFLPEVNYSTGISENVFSHYNRMRE